MKLGSMRWTAALGMVAVGGVAALASQGCTVTAITGPLTDGGFNFDTNPPPQPDSSADQAAPAQCNECLFQQCSGQYTVCQGDPNCRAIYQCAIAPGADVTKCICNSTSQAAQNEYLSLASCDSEGECSACQTNCAASQPSCPAQPVPPGLCATTPPDGGTMDGGATVMDAAGPPADAGSPSACSACTDTSCASEKAACAPGTDCDKYTQCLAACQDATCSSGCDMMYAAGKSAATQLAGCTVSNCSGPCGL